MAYSKEQQAYIDIAGGLFNTHYSAVNIIGGLEMKIAQLQEALRKYGRHGTPEICCEKSKHSDYECNCGFDEALAEVK